MIPITINQILKATNGRLAGSDTARIVKSVSSDTRSILKDALFCALRGENFDGHQFVAAAFKNGAAAAMVDEKAFLEQEALRQISGSHSLIVVPDVYRSLRDLALYYRMQFQIPVIGITGSVGKTTTKECVAYLLAMTAQNICVGRGNFNNHIGLPLNLFNLSPEDRYAVFEMGASAKGEIRYLSELLRPEIGVLTCVHPAHLKGFGSLDGIYQTKLELAEFLNSVGGTLFMNGDDPKLVQMAKERIHKMITFGESAQCDYRLSYASQDGDYLKFTVNERYAFRLKGYGIFNATNALASLAVADFLGVDLGTISHQWKDFVSVHNRFEVEELTGNRIRLVKDCYNANPHAFSMAIKSFQNVSAPGKKIIVAGDMKELGSEAENYHRKLGEELADCGVDFVVVIGEYASVVAQAIQARNYKIPTMQCESNQQVAEFLRSIISSGDAVLFKGSRSMRLEEVVDIFKHELQTQPLS